MNSFPYQVLVVDDDPQIPRLIETWLKAEFGQSLAIRNAIDPTEALGRILADPLDLLITDIDMPAVNGYHLLKDLKTANPMAQVMFLTGQPSQNAFRSARLLGADEYLLKPVKRQSLVYCVQYLLKRLDRWRVDLDLDSSDHERLNLEPAK